MRVTLNYTETRTKTATIRIDEAEVRSWLRASGLADADAAPLDESTVRLYLESRRALDTAVPESTVKDVSLTERTLADVVLC